MSGLHCVEYSRAEGWVAVKSLATALKNARTRVLRQIQSDRELVQIGTAAECHSYAADFEEALQKVGWGADPLLLG